MNIGLKYIPHITMMNIKCEVKVGNTACVKLGSLKTTTTKKNLVCTANREVRLRVALRTDPGVALSCFSPLAVLAISL